MKAPKLTRWEFERMFASESGLSPEKILRLKLVPEECVYPPCADRHCRGWKMVSEKERQRRKAPENAKNQRGAYET